MKKTILISIGVLLLLLIAGVWVYLFMYGTPKSADEVFTRFGITGDEPLPEVIVEREGTTGVSDETGAGPAQRLRQLTLKPVAGATFTDYGILYVEEGTGHVYHINLGSGEEKLLSGTTILGAHDASFSKDGSYVAITSVTGGASETFVGFVDTLAGSLSGVLLPKGARDVHFSGASSTLTYLLSTQTGASGYSYDIEGGESTELFRIPLRDVRVLWGEDVYVHTTPTGRGRGYVYKIEKNSLEYVSAGGLGLSAFLYQNGVVVTHTTGAGVSSVMQSFSGTTTPLDIPLIPEKCTSGGEGVLLYCGVPSQISKEDYPDSWYMGTRSYSDMLLSINTETPATLLLSDFLAESGREIDISKIGTDAYGERIYFINKNDNALWMFDTTL